MKTNRIILTFLVGIIALGSAGISMSLAWFANTTRARIDVISIDIDATPGIRISTDITDFEHAKDHLERSDLKATTLFTPITTAYRDSWLDAKKDKPVFYDDTLGNVDLDLKSISTGFYNQDLYLYSDKDVYVTIDQFNTFIKPNSANLAYAQDVYKRAQASDKEADEWLKKLSVEEIASRLDELTKAMRFAILDPSEESYDFAIVDPNKEDEDIYLGGLLDNNIDRYYDYKLEDNVFKEELFGQINDPSKIVYDGASMVDSGYEYPDKEPNAFNAKHCAGVQLVNLEKSYENGLRIATEDSYSLEDFDNHAFPPFSIPVYADRPNKFNLSIYIEGWDLRSVNFTMGATFDSSLRFIIARRMN